MLIPNKHNGYSFDGIRLYPAGGGGDGGGSGDSGGGGGGGDGGGGGGPNDFYPVPNTRGGSNFVAPVAPTLDPTRQTQLNDILRSAAGQPWGQSGGQYNNALTQGFTSNQIRDFAGQMYGAPSNENFNQLVTHAGMTSPTGRPIAGSAQFYQPIQQQQYQNYANPYTAFNVSTYGTQPMMSTAAQYQANTGGNQQNVSNSINNFVRQNPNADMNSMLAAMRGDINAYDVQTAGGFNNYAPRMPSPQMQQSFNPFTNNFGGGFGGGFMPQMQTPFRQPINNFGGFGGGFMPQQQFTPQMQQFQPQMNMGMQTPFSSGMSQPVQRPQPAAPRSSGPAQPIISRSAGMRGTPNVMRRAEGGITSLMDKA